MTYVVRLGPNARRDRDRIVAWYDDPERRQGDRFLDAFYEAAHQLERQRYSGTSSKVTSGVGTCQGSGIGFGTG
ncbi:MAG: type II toxin-antitoxin system RelE/ParE family toxin [Propioniciclava sp.]|uniref:hypothetical protein n=1 Tax=Propioniciclava sp. TaxID=2038686 RepID=UPI0039E229E0